MQLDRHQAAALRSVLLAALLLTFVLSAGAEGQPRDLGTAKQTLTTGLKTATHADLTTAVDTTIAAKHAPALTWINGALARVLKRHAKHAKAFEALVARPASPMASGKRPDLEARRKRLAERRAEEGAARALVESDEQAITVLRRGLGGLLAALPPEERAVAATPFVRRLRSARKLGAKCTLIETLGHLKEPSVRDALCAQTKSRDPEARIAAIDALGRHGDGSAIGALARCIGDAFWQVRAAAVQAIRAIGGKAAVEALIVALARAEGRIGEDLVAALSALTGENFRDNTVLWRKWWKGHKASYVGPTVAKGAGEAEPSVPGPSVSGSDRAGTAAAKGSGQPAKKQPPGKAQNWRDRTGGTAFYGIESRSKCLVYILDISGSMLSPLGARGAGQTGRRPRGGIGDRKVDQALTELRSSLTALPPDATFNLVFYHHEVTVWSKGQVKATPANRKKAIDWAESQVATGATNIFDALERAFGLAGRGTFDRHYAVAADTFYLLSDGRATTGRFRQGSDMRREVARLNRFRKVKIHTVALGGGADVEFMHGLAQDTGGSFVHYGVRAGRGGRAGKR